MFGRLLLPALFLLLSGAPLLADTIIGPWVPKFKGIDFSVSTNKPPGKFPHLQVVSAFRIDLTNPDIRLLTTPRRFDYSLNDHEVGGLTVSGFLKTNHVQIAINANFFDPQDYYYPANYPMNV